MEPNALNPQNQAAKNGAPDMTKTVSDLHDEGVDIVDQGSSEPDEIAMGSETGAQTEETEGTLDVDVESAEKPTLEKSAASQPQPQIHVESLIPRPTAPSASPAKTQASSTPNPSAPKPQTPPQSALPKTALQQEMQAAWGDSYGTEPMAKPTVHNDPSIKPLRTFKSDAEEAVRYQNISAAQIAIAEQKKKQASTPVEREEGEKSSSVGILALALIILLVGAGGAYYWFFVMKKNPASALPQELRVSTIIPYAKANTVIIGQGNIMDTIGGAIRAAELEPNSVYALIPVPQGTTTVAAPVTSLLRDTKIPSMLSRSLASQYMVGAYNGTTKDPFVILKNTYFQNAFAGMLEWEKDLRNDLISLIRVSRPQDEITLVNRDVFEDTVISNIDARVLRNEEGGILVAYAFADKDTIVIATTVETLKTVLDKLLAVRIVQ